MNRDDLSTALRGIGFRASAEAIRALVSHVIQNHLGPVEAFEQLVLLERRERERRNLERRTGTAQLGNVAPIDRFDWSHPRRIDRAGGKPAPRRSAGVAPGKPGVRRKAAEPGGHGP